MNFEKLIQKVDIEEIYTTVLDLEGPKYPIGNWKALNDAADYIIEKLESYGIEVEDQKFYLDGFEEPFRNIVGYIGDKSKPALLLGSHYDTVKHSPGANDNLSSVAVSLEVARILSKLEDPPSVIIAIFTLEEGHPSYMKRLGEELMKKGMFDSNYRYTKAELFNFNKHLNKMISEKRKVVGNDFNRILKEIIEENKDSINEEMKSFTETRLRTYSEFLLKTKPTTKSWYLVGSTEFVKKAQKDNIPIKNVIVYDCLGWIFSKKGTQEPLPISDDMAPFLKLYKADLSNTIGNFIGVMGEKNSSALLNKFTDYCENEDIDIPHFGLNLPFEFSDIFKALPDVLRSDHAPFWEAGIPGIFVSDTANFRSPHYHTGGDRYFLIDYEMLGKITKATLRTILL